MLRYEESMEGRLREDIEIGRDNATYISGMERWCKNVELEGMSRGLHAEITGLPIGTHTIACPYVGGKVGGSVLRWIIPDFLVEHCAGCPHHTPNGDPSWGQDIIDNHLRDVEESRRQTEETKQRASQLRSELHRQSRQLTARADPEAQQVLEYLAGLFSGPDDENTQSSEQIKRVAMLGADLLPDEAVQLIITLSGTPEYAVSMLPVCTALATRRPDLAQDLMRAALANIENGFQVEMSAEILDSLQEHSLYPLNAGHTRRLILSQDHNPFTEMFMRGQQSYPHSTSVLIKSFDADAESVVGVARNEITNRDDVLRHNSCGAIILIQKQRPAIALDILSDLFVSLNLPDESGLGDGPSTKIVHILRSAFHQSPTEVDRAISTSFDQVRPTVQCDLINVYLRLDQCDGLVDEGQKQLLGETTITRLLTWIRNDHLDIDVRIEAAEALCEAFRTFPTQAVPEIEPLLGYLAIVVAQEPPIIPPHLIIPGQPEHDLADRMDEWTSQSKWSAFKSRLGGCLEAVCGANPFQTFETVSDFLSQPLDQLNNELKTACVSFLGVAGQQYEIRPKALPNLWRALMDFDSPSTRAMAIVATTKMFRSGIRPPPNLVEIIMINLADRYVVVHQSALRTIAQRAYWFDGDQKKGILLCLRGHIDLYRDQPHQLEKICDAMLKIGSMDELLRFIAVRSIETLFPTAEEYVDRRIAFQLSRFCGHDERITMPVARMIAKYLGLHERERANNFGHSKRAELYEWLHQLPIETYRQVSDSILENALLSAQRDPWETSYFASIFAHFNDFQYERIVLDAALKEIPDEPRRAEQRTLMQGLVRAATANVERQAEDSDDDFGPDTRIRFG